MSVLPLFRAVLHPTDFTIGSDVAFAHALRLAASHRDGRRLTIIHVERPGERGQEHPAPPAVRSTLEEWGMLPPGSRREDVFNELGLSVNKVTAMAANVVGAINDHIEASRVDLLVLATRGDHGPPRWIVPSVSERLVRLSKVPTLFVPQGARGFVSRETGEIGLRNVLIPIAREPSPQPAVVAACALAQTLSAASVRMHLFDVGGHHPPPSSLPVDDDRVSWSHHVARGQVVDEIATAARELDVDLVAMSTHGHHGFLDALRGSTTEQVVRRVARPLLAVPVTGFPQRIPLLSFDVGNVAPSTA